MSSIISMIVAMSNGKQIIGNKGEIPWRIPSDMKRFSKITKGHPVIMGRKTHESIIEKLGHPLKDRTSIVLTRDSDYKAAGCETATSKNQALSIAIQSIGSEEIFIIGGAEIYKIFLPFATKLYVSEVLNYKGCGDAIFPEIDCTWMTEYQEQTYEPGDEYPVLFTILKKTNQNSGGKNETVY